MTTKKRSYGTGSLYVRTAADGRESWCARWRSDGGREVKRRLGPKRVNHAAGGLTKSEAEDKLRELRAAVKPTPEVGETLTVAELGERYLESIERKGRKRSTVVGVESIVRCWLAPWFDKRDVSKISKQDVHDLIAAMEEGRKPGARQSRDRHYDKPCAPKSIRNALGTLSALLNFGIRESALTVNVVSSVQAPGVPENGEIRFLEVDEVNALVQHAQSGPYEAIDRALYRTAAMTGLRLGELLALRWQDVDWSASKIRVRQNYVLGEFGTPKSKRSTRSVPMADAVAGELDRLYQRDAHCAFPVKPMRAPADDDLVFGAPDTGKPLDKCANLRRFRRSLKAAKLDESHRFHDLRHTFGTRMAAQGVPMRTVQEWMGHRDISTTQRYADYAPNPHEAALVEAAFGEDGPTAVGQVEVA